MYKRFLYKKKYIKYSQVLNIAIKYDILFVLNI